MNKDPSAVVYSIQTTQQVHATCAQAAAGGGDLPHRTQIVRDSLPQKREYAEQTALKHRAFIPLEHEVQPSW